jgi:hypothetical protein
MKRRDLDTDEQLKTVIETGRLIPRVPNVVRARLLARARATVAASGVAVTPVRIPATPPRWRGVRIALAAAVTLMLVAAGATASFHLWPRRAPAISMNVIPSPAAPSARVSAPELPLPAPVQMPPPRTNSSSRAPRPGRSLSLQESYAGELQLLQRAQSKYASQDFRSALMLLAEHARRFPNGRLAEEREALRVRSLAGAGRSPEARRAFAAFARRFPHSAMLPRLQETARTTEE